MDGGEFHHKPLGSLLPLFFFLTLSVPHLTGAGTNSLMHPDDVSRLPEGAPLTILFHDGLPRDFFFVRPVPDGLVVLDSEREITLQFSRIGSIRRDASACRLDYVDILIDRGRLERARSILTSLRVGLESEKELAWWKSLSLRLLYEEQAPVFRRAEELMAGDEFDEAFSLLLDLAAKHPELHRAFSMKAELAPHVLGSMEEVLFLAEFMLRYPETEIASRMERFQELASSLAGQYTKSAQFANLLDILHFTTLISDPYTDGTKIEYPLDHDNLLWHKLETLRSARDSGSNWKDILLNANVFYRVHGGDLLDSSTARSLQRFLTFTQEVDLGLPCDLAEPDREHAMQYLADVFALRLLAALADNDHETAWQNAMHLMQIVDSPRLVSRSVADLPIVRGDGFRHDHTVELTALAPAEIAGFCDSLGGRAGRDLGLHALARQDFESETKRQQARELLREGLRARVQPLLLELDRPGMESRVRENLEYVGRLLGGVEDTEMASVLASLEEKLRDNESARRNIESLWRRAEDAQSAEALERLASGAMFFAQRHRDTPYHDRFVGMREEFEARAAGAAYQEAQRQREEALAIRRAHKGRAADTAEQYLRAQNARRNQYEELMGVWDRTTGQEPIIIERGLSEHRIRDVLLSEDATDAEVVVFLDFLNQAGVRFRGDFHMRLRRPNPSSNVWKVYSLEE